MAFSGGRRKGKLKALGADRGQGILRAQGHSTAVTYQLDRFQDGLFEIGSGEVEGDLSKLTDDEDQWSAVLQLQGGSEIPINLTSLDPDGGTFEVRQPDKA